MLDALLHVTPPAAELLNAQLPRVLSQAIARLLEKDPGARFQSAAELTQVLEAIRSAQSPTRKWAIPVAIAATALLAFAVYSVWQSRNVRWAREVALPEAIRLAHDEERFIEAYDQALEAEQYIPEDLLLSDTWPMISRLLTVTTEPEGVEVYYSAYDSLDGDWRFVGVTPVEAVRIPGGYYRWRLTKEGYGAVETADFAYGPEVSIDRTLVPEDNVPADMVWVGEGSQRPLGLPGPAELVPAFWMDRYEVTNEQYQQFVDGGGYRKPEYWKHDLLRSGESLTWDEAMPLFVDASGQPGPDGWVEGSYPEGRADHPVTGVSWYEAAAYAEFVGKSLPTIYHIPRARREWYVSYLVPQSNFDGAGTAPVGSYPGMSNYGIYDLAGNVAEWCLNANGLGGRFLAGGSFLDIRYAASYAFGTDPMHRDETAGFRTIKSLAGDQIPSTLTGPVEESLGDEFVAPDPISDEEFQVYKEFYEYDKEPLNSTVEFDDDSASDWTVRKVSFDAAYGNPRERMAAYIYLPKGVTPPHQTVIFLPGEAEAYGPSSDVLRDPRKCCHGADLPPRLVPPCISVTRC